MLPQPSSALEKALIGAEPEGYIRVFLDAGPTMATLLRAVASTGPAGSYARRVLAADSRRTPIASAARRSGRRAERPRARRAPAVAQRPERTRHRRRADGVAEHVPHPHQEHLREARRHQPAGSRRREPTNSACRAFRLRVVLQRRLNRTNATRSGHATCLGPESPRPITRRCDVGSPGPFVRSEL